MFATDNLDKFDTITAVCMLVLVTVTITTAV